MLQVRTDRQGMFADGLSKGFIDPISGAILLRRVKACRREGSTYTKARYETLSSRIRRIDDINVTMQADRLCVDVRRYRVSVACYLRPKQRNNIHRRRVDRPSVI